MLKYAVQATPFAGIQGRASGDHDLNSNSLAGPYTSIAEVDCRRDRMVSMGADERLIRRCFGGEVRDEFRFGQRLLDRLLRSRRSAARSIRS
jgi:hypothetical protein